MEAKLCRHGKPLSKQDVEIVIKDKSVIYTFKKPTRDQAGDYEIKISNGQGEDSKTVNINMQGDRATRARGGPRSPPNGCCRSESRRLPASEREGRSLAELVRPVWSGRPGRRLAISVD